MAKTRKPPRGPGLNGNLHPKQYEVVKARGNVGDSLTLSDGTSVPLARVGPTVIKDPGLAHAVDQEYGRAHRRARRFGDVLVIPVDNNHLHEPGERGHRYTHAAIALPWARYDERTGKRLPDLE